MMYNERIIPLSEWNKYHSYPPLGTLRALVSNSKNNGFDFCLRRIGRRVVILESKFFEWQKMPKKDVPLVKQPSKRTIKQLEEIVSESHSIFAEMHELCASGDYRKFTEKGMDITNLDGGK